MAPAAPRQWPIIDLIELTGQRRRAIAEHPVKRARLGTVVVKRAGAVRVDVIDGVGGQTRVGERRANRRGDRRVLQAPARSGDTPRRRRRSPPAPRRSARPRARARVEILEHEHRGRLADRHALPSGVERPARLGVHQAQRVEAAERQPAQRVGAAGQRRVDRARADGVGGIADRDGARGAGRDDAVSRAQ